MVSSIEPMVKYHLQVAPIVYVDKLKNEVTGKLDTIYMIKSLKEEYASYNVICDEGKWICDCPSYKFQTGTDATGHCKHIRFVIFLLKEKVEIKSI